MSESREPTGTNIEDYVAFYSGGKLELAVAIRNALWRLREQFFDAGRASQDADKAPTREGPLMTHNDDCPVQEGYPRESCTCAPDRHTVVDVKELTEHLNLAIKGFSGRDMGYACAVWHGEDSDGCGQCLSCIQYEILEARRLILAAFPSPGTATPGQCPTCGSPQMNWRKQVAAVKGFGGRSVTCEDQWHDWHSSPAPRTPDSAVSSADEGRVDRCEGYTPTLARIAELEADSARLREALRKILWFCDGPSIVNGLEIKVIAREALAPTEPPKEKP